MKDISQLPGSVIAQFAIDRDTPGCMDRRSFGIVIVIDQDLVFRILNFVIALILIQLPLTIKDEAGASLKDFIQIDLIPPERADLVLAVRGDELIHLQSTASEGDDSADAHDHFD